MNSQIAESGASLNPRHCLRGPGTQFLLAQADFVRPCLGDGCLVFANQAVEQRYRQGGPLLRGKGQRLVYEMVYTSIHVNHSSSFETRVFGASLNI